MDVIHTYSGRELLFFEVSEKQKDEIRIEIHLKKEDEQAVLMSQSAAGEAIDQNNLNIYFDVAQTGTATATVGGTSLTASYADTLVVTNTLLSTQENTDVDTGTETIATVSTLFYDSAFFDYSVNDGTNYRAGTIISVWSGSTVQFTDNSTADIGDTTPVTMSVDISGTDARLRATTSTDNWDIKAFVRAL